MKKIAYLMLSFGISSCALAASPEWDSREVKEKSKVEKPATDIELALSAVTEIEALNSGVLSANRGVFHPKVDVPGQDSKPALNLSKSSQ